MRTSSHLSNPVPSHILTVSVEEYFHAGAFQKALRRKHWDRLESRLEISLGQVLALLRRFNQTATFFVLGCVAHEWPELVAGILADGHEVACSTYWPRSLRGMLPEEFREELIRTREAFRRAGIPHAAGFRSSRGWLGPDDLWALDILAEEGFAYDSSLNPLLRQYAGQRRRFGIHEHQSSSGRSIREFPVATIGLSGIRIGIAGGNWVRQFPHTLLRRFVEIRRRRSREPLVFYFMTWELDRGQPLLSGLSRTTRLRHYRNLGKTRWVFEHYLRQSRFASIAEYLGLPRQIKADVDASAGKPDSLQGSLAEASTGEPVSLVVPLYNEEENVGYLQRTMIDLRQRLAGRYRVHLVLVDDGSNDATWLKLREKFGSIADCTLVRQTRNRGVAAAILAGIERAPTEIVCSIDCDCSYDPYDLAAMIPLVRDADMVTASPYHPAGHVLNVPPWRLFLSKTLSRMYSLVLRDRLHTFTSCCRVYRKAAVAGLQVRNGGFLGVAETLVRLKLQGARIVEYPATLESRVLGESKMKILHTIGGHLGFLRELILSRPAARAVKSVAKPRGGG